MNYILSMLIKEFKVIFRDRQAVILLFVMPMIFIFFLSLAMKEIFNERVGTVLTIVVEKFDSREIGDEIIQSLLEMNNFKIVERPPGMSNKNLFREKLARAVVTIPEGFTESVYDAIDQKQKSVDQIKNLVWEADPVLEGSYKALLKTGLIIAIQAAVLNNLNKQMSLNPQVAEQTPSINFEKFQQQLNKNQFKKIIPNPLQQNVPGWSLFAMFFIVLPLSNSIIKERSEGTWKRLLIYPISPYALIMAKLAPYFVINFIQFFLMLAVGLYIMPIVADIQLQLGANGWHLIPITAVCALASTSYGMMIAQLAKSVEQASAFGSVSVVIMSVLGGLMVPHFVMPLIMQKLSYISPLYWGLQAYLDVLLREVELFQILPKLCMLIGFAAICQMVTWLKLVREI